MQNPVFNTCVEPVDSTPATDFFAGSSAAPLLGPSGTNNRSWTRALRLKIALDPTDGINSESTCCLDLPQDLKSAAGGANIPPLHHHVQQLLVTLLFLRGITDELGVADQVDRAARHDSFCVLSAGLRNRKILSGIR